MIRHGASNAFAGSDQDAVGTLAKIAQLVIRIMARDSDDAFVSRWIAENLRIEIGEVVSSSDTNKYTFVFQSCKFIAEHSPVGR